MIRSLLILIALLAAPIVLANDVSAPAILQIYEARWDTIEDRMADIHRVGYGRLWLPPPARADSGGLSVGYDVFDRFDLGAPRNETLYGTETSFRTLIRAAHAATIRVNTDFIPNHNGFSDSSTFDNQGTADPSDDVTFAEAGGYPGFVFSAPGLIDGDFHSAFATGEEFFRLSGLIDIDHTTNIQLIRQPVEAGNPLNIAAGTVGIFGRPPTNVPDPNNARFYPDQDLGGTTVFDARLGQNVTLFDFNSETPLAGDAVPENGLGLIMRNARWMIQDVGVDGFRIDAARHFPRWVLNYLDQSIFLANPRLRLDGSVEHPFTFIETGYDTPAFLQESIRDDINSGNLSQVGGNRDALDFNLFAALNGNLTANGLANNWHNIRTASIDLNDDGLTNGSQGVAFAQSHDELGPFLQNVAYAYTLMLPGNAIVYQNSHQFGFERDFPRGGKDDALGGFYGETITTLVGIRSSHGRGNFRERWIDQAFASDGFSNVYIYERENSAVVALNSRNDSFVETRTIDTAFAPGAVLVELTGNAADPTVDPQGQIADAVRVDAQGRISVSTPGNAGHGRGYVIYGVAGPQGTVSLSNVAGTLSGGNPNAQTFGITRLADIDVITTDSFRLQLVTNPVTLPAPPGEALPVRDVHADGDLAMFMINDGVDANGNGAVDVVAPDSVAYGFENFTEINTPGYVWNGHSNVGTGTGIYRQTIDTTQLPEGRNYITVRAFRHRDSSTGGDGGPAVFTDFRQTIYIDRLPPEAEIYSFEPFASDPGSPNNRDLVVRSVDGTADSMHVFLNLPATLSDAEIIQMTTSGVNNGQTGYYDRDKFVSGQFDVATGNQVVTVVSYEPTGNVNVQRFTGVYTSTNLGLGFGDLNYDGFITDVDLVGGGGFEQILGSNNSLFNPAADFDGDGLVTYSDLFEIESALIGAGANSRTRNTFAAMLLRIADFNGDGATDAADYDLLFGSFGLAAPQFDLDGDGIVTAADAELFVTDLIRTVPGDFNLDGVVDAADYTVWRDALGSASNAIVDANYDGLVDAADYAIWRSAFGFARQPIGSLASSSTVVPEPTPLLLLAMATAILLCSHHCRLQRFMQHGGCKHG
jgi:hypothetical protein